MLLKGKFGGGLMVCLDLVQKREHGLYCLGFGYFSSTLALMLSSCAAPRSSCSGCCRRVRYVSRSIILAFLCFLYICGLVARGMAPFLRLSNPRFRHQSANVDGLIVSGLPLRLCIFLWGGCRGWLPLGCCHCLPLRG